jgi:hypothetical protein
MSTVSIGCSCAASWQGDYTDLAIEGQGELKSPPKALKNLWTFPLFFCIILLLILTLALTLVFILGILGTVFMGG